jgi:peroxiredoxin 2/4
MEFATLHNEFNALNCELIGLAIDRLRRRIAGFHSIREKTEYRGLKDIDIKFPMIEDITREVAIKYGIIQPDESNTKAVRAVFFIDPECMIRAINYYPPSLDLDFNELKQVIVSLQTEDDAISPTTKSDGKAKELLEIKKEVKKSNEWFFCTRELSEEKVINVN